MCVLFNHMYCGSCLYVVAVIAMHEAQIPKNKTGLHPQRVNALSDVALWEHGLRSHNDSLFVFFYAMRDHDTYVFDERQQHHITRRHGRDM
mgnify:CR=1 FL=1